jgi:hypothetical protein
MWWESGDVDIGSAGLGGGDSRKILITADGRRFTQMGDGRLDFGFWMGDKNLPSDFFCHLCESASICGSNFLIAGLQGGFG